MKGVREVGFCPSLSLEDERDVNGPGEGDGEDEIRRERVAFQIE
jgi:hypothetical protein